MNEGFRRALQERERVVDRAAGQAWHFRPDFIDWLRANFTVWQGFERQANAVYDIGRRHYSARTIGEFLRHETMLRASADGAFKLNNNRWPDLARLYLMLYPEREGFFELRSNEQRAA
jgi:hypothetical protein